MRIALILVSILCAFSVITNCGIGYYGFTLYQKNQAIDLKLSGLNTQVEEKSSQIKTLNDTVSSTKTELKTLNDIISGTKTELLNANNRIQTQTREIADLSKAKDRLDLIMCPIQIRDQVLVGKVTRDQVSRVIQIFFEAYYDAIINDVKYSDTLYANKNDFQMAVSYTLKEDQGNYYQQKYKDSITVTYKLSTDNNLYKAENDSVSIVMGTDCIYYLANP
jgi:hypothetical protein